MRPERPDLWTPIIQKVVHLCCGTQAINAGEVGVDVRPRTDQSVGPFFQMDALDFLILKCEDDSLTSVSLIHGPEHFVYARFCALAKVVWEKLAVGGHCILAFPDISKPLRVDEVFGVESWVVPEHLSGWTQPAIAEVLTRAGFVEITAKPSHYAWMTAVKTCR